jgi:hypothetical protein
VGGATVTDSFKKYRPFSEEWDQMNSNQRRKFLEKLGVGKNIINFTVNFGPRAAYQFVNIELARIARDEMKARMRDVSPRPDPRARVPGKRKPNKRGRFR